MCTEAESILTFTKCGCVKRSMITQRCPDATERNEDCEVKLTKTTPDRKTKFKFCPEHQREKEEEDREKQRRKLQEEEDRRRLA